MKRHATISGCLATVLLPACEFRIGRVDALWLLWLVPLCVAFYVWVFRSKTRIMQRFASADMLVRIASGISRPRQVFKAMLIVLALALGLFSLAELKYGFTWEEVKRQGVDIVLALDVSDSMLVEDVEAGGRLSRLERAKREITDLLRLLEGDRIGLVAFAGTAFLECPLTLDYAAAEIFLDDIDTDLIPIKGTAIGEALRVSLDAFKGSAQDSRAIILITDGEDHGGKALQLAEEAKTRGVRVFTIGIGRDEGSPIPQPGGGFRRDRSGEIVLSKLDETTLQKIALTSGGSYVRSVTGDVDLEKIYLQGIKATLEDQELASQRRQHWKDRFQWIVAICLLLLAIEPFIAERGGSRPPVTSAAAMLVILLALPAAAQPPVAPQPAVRAQGAPATPANPPSGVPVTPLAPGAPVTPATPGAPVTPATPAPGTPPLVAPQKGAPAKRLSDPYDAYDAGLYDQALQGFLDEEVEYPHDPAVQMNIGSAYYQMNNFEEAEKAFSRAALAGDTMTRARAFYNLGNTAYRQGRLDEAIKLYQTALEHNPEDEDAKYNLEFVRDEIRRRHEEAKKRQQEQQGQQQQQQQQGQDDQSEQQDQQNPQQGGQQDNPQQPTAADRDQDGLPDEIEQKGKNPTNPDNPDSDGDGLSDGQEDQNKNGQVDKGETDPNKKDSDGDGVSDAQESESQGDQGAEVTMSPEQAQRYLDSLDEDRPPPKRKMRGRPTRPLKDW